MKRVTVVLTRGRPDPDIARIERWTGYAVAAVVLLTTALCVSGVVMTILNIPIPR